VIRNDGLRQGVLIVHPLKEHLREVEGLGASFVLVGGERLVKPDIVIDFSDESAPVMKKQYMGDTWLLTTAKYKARIAKAPRLTFDEISPVGFTCSDCASATNKGRDFGESPLATGKPLGNGGYEHQWVSPDGRFIAKELGGVHGGGAWDTLQDFYLADTKSGTESFMDLHAYYEMHFTSDSKGLYFYGCNKFLNADDPSCQLYYLDLSKI